MTAVPASIASSRCSAMSWVKIGVSASRPTTTPAWRAEIVQPPWIACGARPRERRLGQRREDQREADPDQDLRRHGQRDLGLRQQRQAAEAAGDEDRAGRGARPWCSAPRRRAGCRRSAASGITETTIAAPIGRQPPALDQQQDEQEEGRGDRRRDHRQREVGRRGAGRPVRRSSRCDDPGRRLVAGDGEDRHRRGQRDRHLDQEDRLPGDELGEHAADRRAERRAGRPGGRPDRGRARARSRPSPAAAPAPRSPPARRPAPARSGRRSAC